MVMEMRDRRVRSQEDVSTLLGLPVIGVLPKPGARNLKALPNQMKQRVLGNSSDCPSRKLPDAVAEQTRLLAQKKDTMADSQTSIQDRSIGNIIAETRNLGADQVEKILAYQREKRVKFGEAA